MKETKLAVRTLLMVTVFIIALVSSVSAEESRLNYSIGLKGWSNQWETGYFFNDESYAGKNVQVTTGSKFTLIPVLAVKYGNVFISGSYYMKSDFSFNKFSYRATYSTVGTITETLASSADRTEWDANIGYYIHPSVALSLGYKNITQDYTSTLSSPGITYGQATSKSTTEIKGPAIGITGNVPISGGFGLYGNLAYGWLKSKYTGVSREDSSTYTLSDTGFNYRAESIPLMINLGYRYQSIYTDAPNGLKGPDITEGIVLGANMIF
ncbi:MAG: hypothetical protein HY096_08960 [Nitrospinae bacterium]|nr:hypothetical protein [Nitrospinota bacterium]